MLGPFWTWSVVAWLCFLSSDCHDNRLASLGVDLSDNRYAELFVPELDPRNNRYQVSKIFLSNEDPRSPKAFIYGTDQDFSMGLLCLLCIIPLLWTTD